MGTITRKVWKCDRCGHEWLSRDNEKPIRCAKCKSPYWNKGSNEIKNRKVNKATVKGGKIKH